MPDGNTIREIERIMGASSVFRNPWWEYLSRYKTSRDLGVAAYQENEPGFPVFVAGATYGEKGEGAQLDALGSMAEAIVREQMDLDEAKPEDEEDETILRSEVALILLYQFDHLAEDEAQAVLYKAGRPVPEGQHLTTEELERRESPHAFDTWYGDFNKHPAAKLAKTIRLTRSW